MPGPISNCLTLALLAGVLWAPCAPASAKPLHGRAAKAEFQREHPCPSNGKHKGRCPGYVIRHANPLACGGPDLVANLQWLTVAEAKAKDRVERHGCPYGQFDLD